MNYLVAPFHVSLKNADHDGGRERKENEGRDRWGILATCVISPGTPERRERDERS